MANNFFSLLSNIVQKRGAARLSAINKMMDYIALQGADEKLVSLHKKLENILEESHQKWPSYDYGEGYFYQSCPSLLIRGFRNTDLRLKIYKLDSILNREDKVLDIGCNAGFLSLTIAKYCSHIDAFDLNPYLIRMAERCREFKGIENVRYFTCSFDQLNVTSSYDLVLSLANHHTFDGNMQPEFRSYLERIRSIMAKGGKLIFESHPGEHKKPFLREQLQSVQDLFRIDSELEISTTKSVYDTNRLVVWLSAV